MTDDKEIQFSQQLGFFENSEFCPAASEGDVFNCFRLILGRLPKHEEWTGHRMAAGRELSAVVRSFLNSLEFANRGMLQERPLDDIELVPVDGFSLYVSAGDQAVGAEILRTRNYEPYVSDEFRRVLKPGMTVLDIGANIGFYTLLAASIVGPEGCCLAVEPNVRNVKLLAASKAANQFSCITVYEGAATREWGLLFLNTNHSNGVVSQATGNIGDLISREVVMGMKLDDLVASRRRLDVIKIDVEGAEYAALSGAAAAIDKHRPVIFSEFSPPALPQISGAQPEEYLDFFISRGYNLSVLGRDKKVDCGSDASLILNMFQASGTDHIDILAVPRK